MARDAHDRVAALAGGPVTLVGCSMGGAICQEWALRHPGDVTALVLISSWCRPDPVLDLVLAHWLRLADVGQAEALGESGALLTFCPEFLREPPELARNCDVADLSGFAAMAVACRSHDTSERLRELAVPTLVVSGRHDRLVAPACAAELSRLILWAEFRMLPTGHVSHWERPAETLELIREFLRRLAS
jgi:3-oxoadipate enol-lactonase